MMTPSIGVAELFVSFVVLVLWLAIPVAILYLLFAINKKLNNIEEQLKRNKDDDKSA